MAGVGLGALAVVTTGPVGPWPQGLVMHRGLLIPEDEVQEFKDRIQAAGGWCAPSEVIYGDDPPPQISPTGIIPDIEDLMLAHTEARVDRWDEEDEWLRQQTKLATMPLPEVE